MAKLSAFNTVTKANTGVEVELRDLRTGKGSGVFITVLGKDSDEFRQAKNDRAAAMRDRVSAGKTDDFTIEEVEDMEAELLARCTRGWRGLEDDDGNDLAFSVTAAQNLYRQYPAIKEQVNIFIGTRANFILA